MLVLSLKHGERVFINGEEVIITIKETTFKKAIVSFEADRSISIVREEELLKNEAEAFAE